jgi:NAD(P)-dependent dehydrogenase (short-subunit alcohol dehydrogenase family)
MNTFSTSSNRVALVTGGSAGLGRALVTGLSAAGWQVITDARRGERLTALPTEITALTGDITDAAHRAALAEEVAARGRLDLLVHNASTLGPTPLPRLDEVSVADLQSVWRPNIGAPLVLTALLLPHLVSSRGVLLSISSDAAVDHYPGWGLYGASKAALDHLTLQFAAENAAITGYAVDPGDMRTEMHQAAFPGEDISDRPLPESVVPALLQLIDSGLPSGRYRAADSPAAPTEDRSGRYPHPVRELVR